MKFKIGDRIVLNDQRLGFGTGIIIRTNIGYTDDYEIAWEQELDRKYLYDKDFAEKTLKLSPQQIRHNRLKEILDEI